MKFLILVFLFCFSLNVKSQDRIIKKEIESKFDPNLKITSNKNDTLYYILSGIEEKISLKDVVAYKMNYREDGSNYYYPKPSDQRIYGIKNDLVYFKADYRFTCSNIEFSKECYLERFRVYDSIINENKKVDLFIMNNETKERVQIPKIKSFYIYLKGDMLHRTITAKLHFTSTDTTQLFLKIEVNKKVNVYRFKNEEIQAL